MKEIRKIDRRFYLNDNKEYVLQVKIPQEFFDYTNSFRASEESQQGCIDVPNAEVFNFLKLCFNEKCGYINGKIYGEYLDRLIKQLERLNSLGALSVSLDNVESIALEILDFFIAIGCNYYNPDDLEQSGFIGYYYRDVEWIKKNLYEYLTPQYADAVERVAYLDKLITRRVDARSFLTAFLSLGEQKETERFTYVMKDGTGLYKIGHTVDVGRRLSSIRTGNSSIELCFFIKGDYEKELHQLYVSKRVWGEWFELDDSDLDFIKKYNQDIQ